jgi:hypothetical protein
MLKVAGKRGFTTLTTFTNFLACAVWGAVPRQWAIYLGLALHFPGISENSSLCVKSAATEIAIGECGMGRGEFAGLFGNLRVLTSATGPYLFGQLYAWGRSFPIAGVTRNLGFWAAVVLGCVLPELFHRMLGAQDMEPTVAAKEIDKKK